MGSVTVRQAQRREVGRLGFEVFLRLVDVRREASQLRRSESDFFEVAFFDVRFLVDVRRTGPALRPIENDPLTLSRLALLRGAFRPKGGSMPWETMK